MFFPFSFVSEDMPNYFYDEDLICICELIDVLRWIEAGSLIDKSQRAISTSKLCNILLCSFNALIRTLSSHYSNGASTPSILHHSFRIGIVSKSLQSRSIGMESYFSLSRCSDRIAVAPFDIWTFYQPHSLLTAIFLSRAAECHF